MNLPIYEDPATAVDLADELDFDPDCERCQLGAKARSTCMKPVGKAGGILAVGQSPTRRSDENGRPWSTPGERNIASIIRRLAGDTPTAFDYAIRCAGGSFSDDTIEACRPYLRRSLDVVQPERVLCFGSTATRVVTGNAAPFNVRRSWARLEDGTLAFFFPEPFRIQSNRILMDWLRADIEWAMRVDPEDLPEPELADYTMIETAEQAVEVVDDLLDRLTALDVETFGVLGEPDFKVVSLALTPHDDYLQSYVWPEEAMYEGDPRRAPLIRLFREGKLSAHNGKYESRSCDAYFGEDLKDSLKADTMIWAKLLRADGAGGLAPLAWQVGMGGHKDEAGEALDRAIHILRALRRAADKPVPTKVETQTRVNDITGRKQRRKVVVESRPPNDAERRQQVIEAWEKPRTMKGERTTYAAEAVPWKYWNAGELLVDTPKIPADWLHASLVDGNPWSYVYGLIDPDVCQRYNARDTVSTALIGEQQRPHIEASETFGRVWRSHLADAPWAVGKVESWGMMIDTRKLDEAERFFTEREAELLAEIQAVKPDINPGSSDQLAELLFKDLRLPVQKKSEKTGKPSTDKSVLKALAEHHPVVEKILEWKSVTKLNGTYAKGLRPFIRSDGRIRASLNITGTETGRMSCSDPNMQTIPSRGEFAKKIKSSFVAPAGHKLVQIDYKALEVRIAAMLSGDPVLLEVFERGGDPHRETAEALSEALWGSPFADCGGLTGEALADEQGRRRGVCKGIVFGTIYGQGPPALAAMTGLTEKEAERAQDLVMGRFRVLRRWIERTAAQASRTGETWTWWMDGRGRRRPVPDIGEQDPGKAGHGKRQAYNTPVQGTGSEFCLASLVACVRWLVETRFPAKLVMTVHDSLIFEVAEDFVDALIEHATAIMVGWPSGKVEIAVDVEVGDDWGSLEGYTLPAAA